MAGGAQHNHSLQSHLLSPPFYNTFNCKRQRREDLSFSPLNKCNLYTAPAGSIFVDDVTLKRSKEGEKIFRSMANKARDTKGCILFILKLEQLQ